MLIKKSPSQASRPTSNSESVCDNQSLKAVHRGGCLTLNLGSALGQRLYLWQMIVFPLVPIVLLVAQNSYTIIVVNTEHQTAKTMEKEVDIIVEESHLLSAVQQERTKLMLSLVALNINSYSQDSALYTENLTQSTLRFLKTSRLRHHLKSLTEYKNQTQLRDTKLFTSINFLILERISGLIRDTSGTTPVWRKLMAYRSVLLASEYLLLSAIHQASPLIPGLTSSPKHDAIARQYLFSIHLFCQVEPDLYQLYLRNQQAAKLSLTRMSSSTSDLDRQPNYKEVVKFMENATEFVNYLKEYQNKLIQNISKEVMSSRLTSFREQTLNVTLLLIILFVSVGIVMLVWHATQTIQTYAKKLIRRTVQLRTEKRKSDCLLNQMLPLPVINQLKQHKQVVAENFDSVTVYFSDIVGFTRISASCSPMEVINMLNSLYRLFDSCIQKYDVYKVETIGDSYMVVSGLPQKNGNKHAAEVATMSLDLLFNLQNYRIPHSPQEMLEVRVGLNTGPCVAGIVGTTMPRYCLFGDTINTASRMESTGEAMKIHMTSETRDFLEVIGGFHMELRGQMEVKGKGFMNTYWLTGKEGGVYTYPEIEFSDECTFIPEFFQIIATSTSDEEPDEIISP